MKIGKRTPVGGVGGACCCPYGVSFKLNSKLPGEHHVAPCVWREPAVSLRSLASPANSYLSEANIPRGDWPSACTWTQRMPSASVEEPVSGEQVRAGWLEDNKQAHTFTLKLILESQLGQNPFCP